MRAELRALQERDPAVAHWMHEDVALAYDVTQAAPGRGLSVEKVTAALAARLKKAGPHA